MDNKLDIYSGFYEQESICSDGASRSTPFSVISVGMSYVSDDDSVTMINTKFLENKLRFEENFKYWNYETNALSVNNYDNNCFKDIVDMGLEAVPFIKDVLRNGPHPVVHALDLIMPGVFQYEGYITLEENCNQWLQLLNLI